MEKALNYIDIFAGCGGLSTGLFNAGWHGLFAVEKNADAFSTLKFNLIDTVPHFVWPEWLSMEAHDINELISKNEDNLKALRGHVTLVAGGPPCQGFSMAGKRNANDQRNKLVESYIQFIKLVAPQVIIFENVHGFTVNFKDKKGAKQYSMYVEQALTEEGYQVAHSIIDMSHFGIPQNRKRFILVAMKGHDPKRVFAVLAESREAFCKEKGIMCTTSVRDAISDLEKSCGTVPSPDTKGFNAGIYGTIQSGYQKLMRQKLSTDTRTVNSHRFVNHRTDTVKLHKILLRTAPRGKRITPTDGIVDNLNRRGVTVLDPNSQSPTITSIPDELVHYCEPRILTVREHARIQSFPDWYEFKGKYTSGGKRRKNEVPRYTQVGNAVPPLFAEQIGRAIKEVLKEDGQHE